MFRLIWADILEDYWTFKRTSLPKTWFIYQLEEIELKTKQKKDADSRQVSCLRFDLFYFDLFYFDLFYLLEKTRPALWTKHVLRKRLVSPRPPIPIPPSHPPHTPTPQTHPSPGESKYWNGRLDGYDRVAGVFYRVAQRSDLHANCLDKGKITKMNWTQDIKISRAFFQFPRFWSIQHTPTLIKHHACPRLATHIREIARVMAGSVSLCCVRLLPDNVPVAKKGASGDTLKILRVTWCRQSSGPLWLTLSSFKWPLNRHTALE